MKHLPPPFGVLEKYAVVDHVVIDTRLDLTQMTHFVRVCFASGTRAVVIGTDLEQMARDLDYSLGQLHEQSRQETDTDPIVRRGKALGFRSWRLEGYELRSANSTYGSWRVDKQTKAVCKHCDHAAPYPGCQCGLYALHSPEFASRWHGSDPHMVHGAVRGWGLLEVHHEGWRAQYAEPVLLAIDGNRQTRDHCTRVQAIGGELGLPVVEWDDFVSVASMLAEPVPQHLRPPRPERRDWRDQFLWSATINDIRGGVRWGP